MSASKIKWPVAAWNPTTGCDRISPGCNNRFITILADHTFVREVVEHATAIIGHMPRRLAPWRPDLCAQALFGGTAGIWTAIETKTETLWSRPRQLPNVWLGVGAESQNWTDIRIPRLTRRPAKVESVSAEPLGLIDLSRGFTSQVAEQLGGRSPLDDQIGKHRLKECNRVCGPVDGPSTHRLPSAALDAGMIPSDISADLLLEPVDHVSCCAVDGDPDAACSLGSPPDVEIPLAIEHPSDVPQRRRIGRHDHTSWGTNPALSALGYVARIQAPPNRPAPDTVSGSEFINRRPGLVGGGHVSDLGDLAQRHDPHLPLADRQIYPLLIASESSRRAWAIHPDQAGGIREQCLDAGIAFPFEQRGEYVSAELWISVTSQSRCSRRPLVRHTDVSDTSRPDAPVCKKAPPHAAWSELGRVLAPAEHHGRFR